MADEYFYGESSSAARAASPRTRIDLPDGVRPPLNPDEANVERPNGAGTDAGLAATLLRPLCVYYSFVTSFVSSPEWPRM